MNFTQVLKTLSQENVIILAKQRKREFVTISFSKDFKGDYIMLKRHRNHKDDLVKQIDDPINITSRLSLAGLKLKKYLDNGYKPYDPIAKEFIAEK